MAISLQIASALAGASTSPSLNGGGTLSSADTASPFAALFGNLLSDPTQLAAQGELAQQTAAQTDGELTEQPADAEEGVVDAASQSLVAALFAAQNAPAAPAPVAVDGSADVPAGEQPVASVKLNPNHAAPSAEGDDAVDVSASGGSDVSDFAKLLDTPVSGESLPEMAAKLAASGDPKAAIRRLDAIGVDSTAVSLNAVSSAEAPSAKSAATAASAPTPASQLLTAQYAVAEPVGSSRWSEAIGQRAMFMVEQQVKTAELHLNPPHLGPMEVKLSMDGDKTSLNFITSQAAVKEALQQSLPRLQQVFADNGMAGLEVQVQLGHRQSQPDNPSNQPSERAFSPDDDIEENGKLGAISNPIRWQGYSYARARGGVDTFA